MPVEVESDPFPGLTLERIVAPEVLSEIFAVAWAPDGKMFATGSKDKVVRIWRSDGELVAALNGHSETVLCVAFSPDGKRLASGSVDNTIRVWDVATGRCMQRRPGHLDRVCSVAWSRDETLLVSASDDCRVLCWPESKRIGASPAFLLGHNGPVNCMAVSPVADLVASASLDRTVRLWSIRVEQLRFGTSTGDAAYVLTHPRPVNAVCFSRDGRVIATGCSDAVIRIWNVETGELARVLEGHTTDIRALAFSPDGRFLASKSDGGTVRLWRCDLWQQVGELREETTSEILSIGISCDNRLATFTDGQCSICLWRMDPQVLLLATTVREQYCNAKVVLVGDSGVGKSGLALALAGERFVPTESTHGRHVWRLDERVETVAPDLRETREILLWDLAGQPTYRFVHQLHLHDTTVAIVVFDARSDTDPLGGVRHWDRALRQARRRQGADEAPLRKVLVVARVDRGGVSLGGARLAQLCAELEIRDEDFFETSAKEGWGIAKLRESLNRLIDWDRLPKVTSTQLFHDIKHFVVSVRGRGQRLLTVPTLCDAFVAGRAETMEAGISAQLGTCVGRLEASGLVRRFTFGNYVLLEPELLDAYASAIVEAAREEPDGLGIIAEDDVRAARFRMPHRRIADAREEEVLLIATIESLVRGEIALREVTDNGVVLVFPAQSTREAPEEVAALRPSHRIAFEGSARIVYATLAVRLARSGVFQRGEIWRDGLLVSDAHGVRCGVRLDRITEAGGELEVLISSQTAPVIRAQLEQFVVAHAMKKAITATVRAEAVLTCACGEVFASSQIRKRLELKKSWIVCPVCEERTPIVVPGDAQPAVERATREHVIVMDRDADTQRDLDVASISLQGKETARDFDVFLCHNSRDKAAVKAIGNELKARGYLPWLDEWELTPGQRWMIELEKQIATIRSAAVFVGGDGQGPWQDMELDALLRQFVKRGCPVIPVILPSVTVAEPRLPTFLESFTWVDFRLEDPRPLDRLIWGITKTKPRMVQP